MSVAQADEEHETILASVATILTTYPQRGTPSVEAYEQDLTTIAAAQKVHGTNHVYYFDYRWSRESIARFLETGEQPRLPDPPLEFAPAFLRATRSAKD